MEEVEAEAMESPEKSLQSEDATEEFDDGLEFLDYAVAHKVQFDLKDRELDALIDYQHHALHRLLAQPETCSAQGVERILEKHPECIEHTDANNDNPLLHYLNTCDEPNAEVVRVLLAKKPDLAKEKNHEKMFALMKYLTHGGRDRSYYNKDLIINLLEVGRV